MNTLRDVGLVEGGPIANTSGEEVAHLQAAFVIAEHGGVFLIARDARARVERFKWGKVGILAHEAP